MVFIKKYFNLFSKDIKMPWRLFILYFLTVVFFESFMNYYTYLFPFNTSILELLFTPLSLFFFGIVLTYYKDNKYLFSQEGEIRKMLREKSKLLICIAAVIVMAAAVMPPEICFAADQNTGVQDSRTDEFKVIGYYCGEQFDVPVEKLQAEKLTHVIYGFLIPTEDGTCKPFQEPEELTKLIETCQSSGTKVYVSVGGYFDKDGSPLFNIFE